MNGQDIVDRARPHIGERYVFGAEPPKDDAASKGPWDCASFVSWCVYQLTHTLYGCYDNHGDPHRENAYTGFWRRDAALCKRITIAEAATTPGAILLRYPQPGATGHIVISDGHAGTVEAHSTKRGVIAHVIAGRRWDVGLLIPGVTYATAADKPIIVEPLVYRLTHPLMKGDVVKRIQTALRAKGFAMELDGVYGPVTAEAVRRFQKSEGLLADGEAGPDTMKALGLA